MAIASFPSFTQVKELKLPLRSLCARRRAPLEARVRREQPRGRERAREARRLRVRVEVEGRPRPKIRGGAALPDRLPTKLLPRGWVISSGACPPVY